VPFAAVGPSAYWYLTRGTGAVSLILLTGSILLGVIDVRRLRIETVPRFVIDAVHRNVSLLAIAFLFVHIVTSLLDGFAPIRLVDVVLPFASKYRPVWLGLGAVASDLLIAVAITSLIRRRLGYGAWRMTHWLAYACFPVAVVHGLGTGSDTKSAWMLALTGACVVVVLAAVVYRATAGWPAHRAVRSAAIAAAALTPALLIAWLPSGPLAAGWAKRAGTPSSLLAAGGAAAGSRPASQSSGQPAASASGPLHGFTAQVSGTVQQGQLPSGLVQVDISLSVRGQSLDTLHITLDGEPVNGGGVAMTSSDVTLGSASDPRGYRGRVVGLNGPNIEARVLGAGGRLTLLVQLQIDPGSGAASGTLTATPR
jgi:hypothetical protein